LFRILNFGHSGLFRISSFRFRALPDSGPSIINACVIRDVSKQRLVDAHGSEMPCQFTPTVRWFRDRSVRWVLLHFHGPAGARRAAELNAFLRRPLFARCPPEWYCEKTRAFGRLASSNPALYPRDKRWIVKAYDHFFEQNRRAMVQYRDFVRDTDAYGMFNFFWYLTKDLPRKEKVTPLKW